MIPKRVPMWGSLNSKRFSSASSARRRGGATAVPAVQASRTSSEAKQRREVMVTFRMVQRTRNLDGSLPQMHSRIQGWGRAIRSLVTAGLLGVVLSAALYLPGPAGSADKAKPAKLPIVQKMTHKGYSE